MAKKFNPISNHISTKTAKNLKKVVVANALLNAEEQFNNLMLAYCEAYDSKVEAEEKAAAEAKIANDLATVLSEAEALEALSELKRHAQYDALFAQIVAKAEAKAKKKAAKAEARAKKAEAREKKGLSQRQLAKLAKINNSELSKIESGIRKDPSPKILRKISNIIDVNYSDLMYMIGLGLEVTQLNYFVKSHYASLNLEQLDTAEINVLGSIENSESIVSTCKKELEKDDLPEEQKELLIHTIEDHTYQINSSKEIIKLIQSLKVKERNKNAKN